MLKNVFIKNLALIEEADIDYTSGLNIMTGETGSGKSIIISALNTALGEKANKSMIRTGADHGLVELSFLSDDFVYPGKAGNRNGRRPDRHIQKDHDG